jgi:hypothetical protein
MVTMRLDDAIARHSRARVRRPFRIATLVTLVGIYGAAALGASGGARAADTVGGARLEGTFLVLGRVTKAIGIPAEKRGATVLRGWVFAPGCPTGPCATVTLERQRAGGVDLIALHSRAPDYYVGKGSFTVAVQCGRRTFPAGEVVPFTITVRITATTTATDGLDATNIRGTYVNLTRINRTRCVAAYGRDAAKFHGHVISTLPPTPPAPPPAPPAPPAPPTPPTT